MKNKKFKIILYSFVCLVLFFIFLFQVNKTSIYAQLGKFYTKNNAYISAQKYFEKSYNLGNKDTDFRVMYVNSLVNSPLTIEAQEKLVNIVNDDIKDSASDSAEYFLRNLKKEIHNKYPQNYVRQAAYNQKIMHWGKLPITYSIKNIRGIPEEIPVAVNDAFDTWERSSSAKIKFKKVQGDNADIVVSFDAKQIKNPQYGTKYVIANTTPVFSQNKLEKMEICFNIYNLNGELFTPNQIYNTALHEIFHSLGLMGHSSEEGSIMNMSKTANFDKNDARQDLSEADIDTLDLFYKIKPDITNAEELKYDYIPYLVLGNNAEVNSTKAEEAKEYIKKAPTIPAGYIDYAQILLNEKKYTLSISYLNKALRLATDEHTKNIVYYNLAVANYYDGNYELARVFIDKVMEYKDDNDFHVLSAEIYVKQGKQKDAISEYENLINKNNDNIDYVINLANIYIKNKNYGKARAVLKQFVKNNPDKKNNKRINQYKFLIMF